MEKAMQLFHSMVWTTAEKDDCECKTFEKQKIQCKWVEVLRNFRVEFSVFLQGRGGMAFFLNLLDFKSIA